jgi:hypothetical protein
MTTTHAHTHTHAHSLYAFNAVDKAGRDMQENARLRGTGGYRGAQMISSLVAHWQFAPADSSTPESASEVWNLASLNRQEAVKGQARAAIDTVSHCSTCNKLAIVPTNMLASSFSFTIKPHLAASRASRRRLRCQAADLHTTCSSRPLTSCLYNTL